MKKTALIFLTLMLFLFSATGMMATQSLVDDNNISSPEEKPITINPATGDSVIRAEMVPDTTLNTETIATPAEDIEQDIIDHIYDAIILFVNYVIWLFVIVFIILTWLIGDYSQATNKAQWLNFLGKIPRLLLAFIVGILQMAVFYWGFDFHGKEDVMRMLFSILTALIVYKIGINKFLAWVSKRLGIELEK